MVRVRLALLLLLITVAGSCAKKTLVALVPDPDGKTGSVFVSNKAGSVAIRAPYQATTVGDADKRPTAPAQLSTKALNKIFEEALSIQPERPLHFQLYSKRGVTLTAASAKLLPKIIAAIRERNSMYISLIGHADTLGTNRWNMGLSHGRAMEVKMLLVKGGVAANTIWISYSGEENPLIPTADNVWELGNRAVEVIVR